MPAVAMRTPVLGARPRILNGEPGCTQIIEAVWALVPGPESQRGLGLARDAFRVVQLRFFKH
jgi:hypothetical protein